MHAPDLCLLKQNAVLNLNTSLIVFNVTSKEAKCNNTLKVFIFLNSFNNKGQFHCLLINDDTPNDYNNLAYIFSLKHLCILKLNCII